MKKSTKILLIIVIMLAIVGGGLCISAFAMGLNYKNLSGMARNGLFEFDEWWDSNDIKDVDSKNIKKNTKEYSETVQDVLKIKIDFGKLVIKSTDLNKAYLETDQKKDEKYFEFKETDSSIEVRNDGDMFGHLLDTPEATLYLPEDIEFKVIELNIDAGECLIQTALKTERMMADVDAGKVSVQKMTADRLELDCDAGHFIYEGQVVQGGTVDVDAGNAELYLKEKSVNDYNYSIDVDAGSLMINEEKYSGMDKERYIDNKASGTWSISCDAGKTELNIEP